MPSSYFQRGGGRFGMLNVTWPFVSIRASEDGLKITCFASTYEFPKREIRRLKKHSGIFSVGLQIEHDNPNYPSFFVFWASLFYGTSGFPDLKKQLENLGYEVVD